MPSNSSLDHVRPRPVRTLPELAPVNARRRTAEQLMTRFNMSETAAQAIADAAVDQNELRASVANPERRRVSGGSLIVARTHLWTRRVSPDPANMRTAYSRVHPFAVTPGAGNENSRFAPLGSAISEPTGRPELVNEVESRRHLDWAHAQAAEYVRRTNNWCESIATQGVMEAVWVTAVTYRHLDNSADLAVCQTAEGSSRITSARINVSSETTVDITDDLYDLKDAALRAQIARINESIELGRLDEQTETTARSFIVPAMVILDFEADEPDQALPFHAAVQSLVALRHVDPPAPWGEAAEMEALADGVLDELERRRIIPRDRRRYLAGAMTRDEAAQAHFSSDPAVRAAFITDIFTSGKPEIQQAIRAAVTTQSTRRQIRSKLKDQLSAALIMRGVDDAGRRRERVRKYLNEGVGQEWHRKPWKATGRSVDDLEQAALLELETPDGPSSSTIELAARAMYPLITRLQLHADRGTANNQQQDRRNPGTVLDVMRRSPHGVRQLAQALRDSAAGKPTRMVGTDGSIVLDANGRAEEVDDETLRIAFPAPGRPTGPNGPADTPQKQLSAAIAEFGNGVHSLRALLQKVADVRGAGGASLVGERGVDPTHVEAWLQSLDQARDLLMRWKIVAEMQGPPKPDADERNDNSSMDPLLELELDELRDLADERGVPWENTDDREALLDRLADAGAEGSSYEVAVS